MSRNIQEKLFKGSTTPRVVILSPPPQREQAEKSTRVNELFVLAATRPPSRVSFFPRPTCSGVRLDRNWEPFGIAQLSYDLGERHRTAR